MRKFDIFFCPWFSGVEKQRFSGVFMIKISLSEMVVKLEAQDNAWSKSFSEMDG
jgi:hypothetical protein